MKEDLALCKRSLARENEQNRSLALQLEATKLLATPTSSTGPIGPLESASPSASTDSESSSSTSAASASAARRYPIDSVSAGFVGFYSTLLSIRII